MTEGDNSYWLEIERLQRCLAAVEDHGVQISTVATDRHGGIGKLMREHHGHIDHEYDMWHVAKCMKKNLSKKGNNEISLWLPAIVNHLWYCASTCSGDVDVLKTKWLSLLYHITNRHQWRLALGSDISQCEHAPNSADELASRPWLLEESDAFSILEATVSAKNLLSDLERVTY